MATLHDLNRERKMSIVDECSGIFKALSGMELPERIDAINEIRASLGEYSPFSSEPVDCVFWMKNDMVVANDYNPNSVAPPEMELLRKSISNDGYTQPIVSWPQDDGTVEVIDGFHRHRVGKECPDIQSRVLGYLPVVKIRPSQEGRSDRMASTIRHNRARGKHAIESMSDIVIELKKRNWTDTRIGRELGMEQDEILRLCQISGLTDIFSDQEFSKSWDVEGAITEDDFEELTDDITGYDEAELSRTVNTGDKDRIFHTFDKWECNKAGFYSSKPPSGMTKDDCKAVYRDFLADLTRFEAGLSGVTGEWKRSCEHYLTNTAMNRIAWLGQAALCYSEGIPSEFRGGFGLLTEGQQEDANEMALKYLNKWLVENNLPAVEMSDAIPSRQSEIY